MLMNDNSDNLNREQGDFHRASFLVFKIMSRGKSQKSESKKAGAALS